ncbi:MAG: glycosyltransferase family 9 protein [Bdellovibrionia bacterium]
MKLLIIRFSSFGDIVQCLGVPHVFKQAFKEAEIHWVVRGDFADLLLAQKPIHKVWSFDRKEGLGGLLSLAKQLRAQNFTHVYDAHNNLRSHILSLFLSPAHFVRRPKNRWRRFLLFQLGRNTFSFPFVGQRSYIEPLEAWTQMTGIPPAPQLEIPHTIHQNLATILRPLQPFTALAPSTAWPKKNWPIEHWKRLIQSQPLTNFVILGGAQDPECKELANLKREGPGQTLNMAGRLSWLESCGVIEQAEALVSADTGLLHSADQIGKNAIALIGPTAFGHPARTTSRVLEVPLDCRPCTKDGRGKCHNTVYQKCMVDITPERVATELSKARGT